tara:strand:- start:2038 stop:2223 length:186 start_codon:yes stop_codon:yes gene_type:complete
MADDIDRAAAITDLFLAKALQHREPTKRAKGSCYNCGDPLPQDKIYCDRDCEMDYEKIHRQ